jgi:hypothetical protein
MDELKTGVFEISTNYNELWMDWQEELAAIDLERRARTAIQELQRPGVPYVTCLYPVEKRGDKLVLSGFCVLAKWEDCEIGEACAMPFPFSGSLEGVRRKWPSDDYYNRFEFVYENKNHEAIYIYRRIR